MGFLDKILGISEGGRKGLEATPVKGLVSGSLIIPSLHMTLDGTERVFPLSEHVACGIGRDPDNAIVLPELDRGAGRKHASVQRLGGGRYVLTDLRSRNGTKINGRRVEEKILGNGDVIQIGACTLIYEGPESHTDDAGPQTRPLAEQTTVMFKERLVTVLAIDIRDSVVWARDLGDDRWADLVMKLIETAGAMFNKRGCAGQKYIGDAMMAVWEHENGVVTDAELAEILAAVADLRRIFSETGASFNLPAPLRFGCGINSGDAAMGYMAGQVALGNTVNKTFRLESATKELGCDVVIGEATVQYLGSSRVCDRLPGQILVEVKGFSNPEPVYTMNFDALSQLNEFVVAGGCVIAEASVSAGKVV